VPFGGIGIGGVRNSVLTVRTSLEQGQDRARLAVAFGHAKGGFWALADEAGRGHFLAKLWFPRAH